MSNFGVKSIFMRRASGFPPRADHVDERSPSERCIWVSKCNMMCEVPEKNEKECETEQTDCQNVRKAVCEHKATDEEDKNRNLHEQGEELDQICYDPSFNASCMQFSFSGLLLGVMECFAIIRAAR